MSWTIDGSPRRQRTIFLEDFEEQVEKAKPQASWQDDPEFMAALGEMMEVLARFPEARMAVIDVWEKNVGKSPG